MPVYYNKNTGAPENTDAYDPAVHEIPLVDAQGQTFSAPEAEAQQYLQDGYKQPDQKQLQGILDKSKYESTGEQLKTAAEGALSGAVGPLAPGIEKAYFGATDDSINKRREINPGVHALGQTAGLVGSSMTGVGEGALLGKAGDAIGAATAGLGKIGSATARGAIENALFQSGDEVSKMITNDPAASAETALANVGMSALLGGGIGAGFGTVSKSWEMLQGSKLSGELANFRSRYNQLADYPQTATALKEELQGLKTAAADFSETQANKALNIGEQRIADSEQHAAKMQHLEDTKSKFTQDLADEIQKYHDDFESKVNSSYGSSGLKSKVLEKEMPKYSKGIKAQTSELTSKVDSMLEEMKLKEHLYPAGLVAKFEDAANGLRSGVFSENSSQVFSAMQDFKQIMQGYAKLGKRVGAHEPAYDFIQKVRPLAAEFREALENTRVWKKVGKYQKDINSAFSKSIGPSEELQSKFMTDVNGKMVVDSAKVRSYVNSLSADGVNIKKEVLKNFMEHGGNFGKVADDISSKLGLEAKTTANSKNTIEASLKDGFNTFAKPNKKDFTKALQDLRNEKQVYKENYRTKKEAIQDKLGVGVGPAQNFGSKIADALVGHSVGEAAAGAGLGAGIGHVVGHPVWGALIGGGAGKAFGSVFHAILGPLLKEGAVSGAGFKAGMQYGDAVAKGMKKVANATAHVFDSAVKVAGEPSAKDLKRLRDQVTAVAENPAELTKVAQHVGAYLHDHGANLSAAAARNMQYLASLKPQTAPVNPLDEEREPNAVEEAQYDRALSIAERPTIVMGAVKQGSVTLKDLQHLKTMFPALYSTMQTQLIENLADAKSKGKTIPYKTKIGLSAFLGQALDSTMTPASIQGTQATMMGGSALPQAGPIGPKAPKLGQNAPIGKMPSIFNTRTNSRIASRSNRH